MQQSLFAAVLAPSPAEEMAPVMTLDTLMTEGIITVIDVETTGLSAKKNSLTEVTAIQYQHGEEIGKFSTLVRPAEPIPEEVIRLTGIDNDMVKGAPELLTVMTDLCKFVGESPVIVGHNVGFDIRFITEKLSQTGLGMLAGRFDMTRALCTRTLATKLYPGLPSYEGIVVATHCGVVNPNPHRAEADVRMSAGILHAMVQKVTTEQGAPTLQAMLTIQGALS